MDHAKENCINGQWNTWSEWSTNCTKTCGGGTFSRLHPCPSDTLFKVLGAWKIPSQCVYGRSMDFRNMSNKIIGWAIFEIWNMGNLVRVLGDIPEIFDTPQKV